MKDPAQEANRDDQGDTEVDSTAHPAADSEVGPTTPLADHVTPTQTCERCGHDMYDRHCKVICPNCGYLRDCSDP